MSDRSLRDEDLVRVRSLSELRPGMTVVVKGCHRCEGKTHTEILVSSEPRTRDWSDHAHGPCRATVAWNTASGFACAVTGQWCFCSTVPEGRLYRLRSSDGKEREEGAGLDRKAQFYQSALKLRREGAL